MGSIYGIVAPKELSKLPGTENWNSGKVQINKGGKEIKIYLNKILMSEYTPAKPKPLGGIALQAHDGGVNIYYQNIHWRKIK